MIKCPFDQHPETRETHSKTYGMYAESSRSKSRDELYREDINHKLIARVKQSGGSFSSEIGGSRIA